jgi:branched-chain amino acid transport system substrate-binding protein
MQKGRILFLIFFSLNVFLSAATLQDLNNYAQKQEENPPIQGKDLLTPDYTKFYKSQIGNFFVRKFNQLFEFFHLKKKPFCNLKDFKRLLETLIQGKERGDFIYKFTPKIGSKFVIWGDLHGAFHSLIRDLDKLKELKIIDGNLKISEGYNFIFNGDVINRAAYSLETLYLVMILIHKNPNKIFYLRGNHEIKQNWYRYGLKRELDIKSQFLTEEEQKKLYKDIDFFFNTLSTALFLKVQNEINYVCISHYGLSENELKLEKLSKFLSHNISSQKIENLNLNNANDSNGFVNIDVVIKGIGKSESYFLTNGLSMLLPDKGATAWALFSSPTTVHKKIFKFFDDAFSIVEVGKDIYNWKISSYIRDTRKKKSDFVVKSYYLVSGQTTEKPPCDGNIKIGSMMDLTKVNLADGNQVFQGIGLRVNQENQNGGVNKKYIKFIALNDSYEPVLAAENTEKFLNDYKTDILISPNGSPSLQSYLNFVKDKKFLVLFPITGSGVFRKPELNNIIHLRASYPQESKALMEYAIKNFNTKRVAIFYQNDIAAFDSVESAKEVLSQNKITEVITIPYERELVDFSEAAKKILSFKPNVILLLPITSAAIKLIQQIGADNLIKTNILAWSDMASIEFEEFMKSKGLKFTVAQIIPDLKSSNLEIVKDYRKESKKNEFSLDSFALESYIGASVFIDVVKQLKEPITKKIVLEKIKNIKNYNFKGIRLNFNPQTNALANNLWIVTENNKRILWEGKK